MVADQQSGKDGSVTEGVDAMSGEERMMKRTEALVEFRRWLVAAMPAGRSEQVAFMNGVRQAIHETGPFAGEPVDFVEWVPAAEVTANDYNPNAVAPPEMELLRLSIMADGYTQPIVTNEEGAARVVVDGFHRNRVGKECADVAERLHGYLPVVQIRSDRLDRGDRIAATIRHNRARGKHQVVAMSEIVLELKRRNWSDGKIGKELGMDPDEVLRLAQISGLAEAFADRAFSEAWEVDLIDETDDLDDEAEGVGSHA
jgi:ParB-like chromosome segregation protein Spo0J